MKYSESLIDSANNNQRSDNFWLLNIAIQLAKLNETMREILKDK